MKKAIQLHLRYKAAFLVIMICLVLMGLVCVKTTGRFKKSNSAYWLESIKSIADEIEKPGYKKEDIAVIPFEDYFSGYSYNGKKVSMFAFYHASFNGKAGDVICSVNNPVLHDQNICTFFRNIGSQTVYNKMITDSSGATENFVLNDTEYFIVFQYIEDLNIVIGAFVPYEPVKNVTKIYYISFTLLSVIVFIMFFALILNISKNRKEDQAKIDEMLHQMHQKDVRNEILTSLMNEFTFEYNIKDDVMALSKKYQTVFQRGKYFVHFLGTISSRYTIFHQDVPEIINTIQKISNGLPQGNILFRLQVYNGSFEWFQAIFKVMYNDIDEPIYVIGKIMNVHKEQMEKQNLLNRSIRDGLTNLLNRAELEKRTTAYMNSMGSNDMGALLIMDLDHFKMVNDTFGHSKGDDLLRNVAELLRATFRTNDIVGRLGGDEFYVFMKDVLSKDDVINKCEYLRKSLLREVTYGDQTVNISSSMGIAFVKKGSAFLDIYMKADSALYRSKENGRNQINIYSEEI